MTGTAWRVALCEGQRVVGWIDSVWMTLAQAQAAAAEYRELAKAQGYCLAVLASGQVRAVRKYRSRICKVGWHSFGAVALLLITASETHAHSIDNLIDSVVDFVT